MLAKWYHNKKKVPVTTSFICSLICTVNVEAWTSYWIQQFANSFCWWKCFHQLLHIILTCTNNLKWQWIDINPPYSSNVRGHSTDWKVTNVFWNSIGTFFNMVDKIHQNQTRWWLLGPRRVSTEIQYLRWHPSGTKQPSTCLILSAIDIYSISQEICTRFCCALLCCGYTIVHNEFTWSIYPYSSVLLCWHWGNR